MDFQDRTCVVTGGAGGIGRGIARRLLESGALVAVVDIDAVAGQRLIDDFGEDRLLFYPGDLADKAVLEAFARRVTRRFGDVGVLVNNACAGGGGLLSGSAYEEFLYLQRVGVAAPYYLTSLLRDHFAPGAAIVNIASTRAAQSQPDTESYSAAKGGILALTHAMAVSLAGRARVNAISPGWIDTQASGREPSEADRLQHPAGRIGAIDDVVSLALFLCGGQAGFLNGETVTLDGGMSRLMIYHGENGWSYDPNR